MLTLSGIFVFGEVFCLHMEVKQYYANITGKISIRAGAGRQHLHFG